MAPVTKDAKKEVKKEVSKNGKEEKKTEEEPEMVRLVISLRILNGYCSRKPVSCRVQSLLTCIVSVMLC